MADTPKPVSLRVKTEVRYNEPKERFSRTVGDMVPNGSEPCSQELESSPIDAASARQAGGVVLDQYISDVGKSILEHPTTSIKVSVCPKSLMGTKVETVKHYGEPIDYPVPIYHEPACRTVYEGSAGVSADAFRGWITSSEEMLALNAGSEGEQEATAALPETGSSSGLSATPSLADHWVREGNLEPKLEPVQK